MSMLLPMLMTATGLKENDLRTIIRTAPIRYKDFTIEKRNGGRRLISQPAREVKALQRILLSEVLNKLPVHISASAYRTGTSILDNASAHAGDGPIMKIDFANFFPSIVASDWHLYCEEKGIFAQEGDIEISKNILFKRNPADGKLRLAIGAPSSPCLSNLIMYNFDVILRDKVSRDKVVYTRYADDLTFSGKRTGFLTKVMSAVKSTIKEVKYPSLVINNEKTVVATRRYKRVVTGLVLTNDGKVSLGHRRKREIRAAMHHALNGKLSVTEEVQLAGMLAFAHGVEPEFLDRMVEKYGPSLLTRLKAVRKPPWPYV